MGLYMQPTFRLTACILIFTLGGLSPAYAQTSFPQPRDFIIDQPCEAYTSLKKQTNPVALAVGQTYSAVGENKQPDATHAAIKLGTENKWVALICGHYTDASPATGSDAPPPTNAACLPFFDDQHNPVKLKVGGTVDITPPAPTLNAFDQAINTTCGTAGKVVTGDEFKTLLRNHPEVLQRLMAFTGQRVFADRPPRPTTEDYLQDLSAAWFNLKAFDHIFCGEPGAEGKIGGLHFHGRYLQLQHSGEACRMDNYRQNEVEPGVIYTMGVTMKTASGEFARHSTKGYGLTLSAEDILKTVTRAFADNPTGSNESTACLLPVADDGKQFTTVFVRRANGIRTFYPDATPAANDPTCSATIDLSSAPH